MLDMMRRISTCVYDGESDSVRTLEGLLSIACKISGTNLRLLDFRFVHS